MRFHEQVGKRTAIKLMTDGILLAETQGDRLLRAYDTIIIDEAHERSLNIDFLLGYLKRVLPRRPDTSITGALPKCFEKRSASMVAEVMTIFSSGREWLSCLR